jgi:hypothetical protein
MAVTSTAVVVGHAHHSKHVCKLAHVCISITCQLRQVFSMKKAVYLHTQASQMILHQMVGLEVLHLRILML